jgi:hypothetical protein
MAIALNPSVGRSAVDERCTSLLVIVVAGRFRERRGLEALESWPSAKRKVALKRQQPDRPRRGSPLL